MNLPEKLLLSNLLCRRVCSEQGIEYGLGLQVWMHPAAHRVLGWVSRPLTFSSSYTMVWRVNQLYGLTKNVALIRNKGTRSEIEIMKKLPTFINSILIGNSGKKLGIIADIIFDVNSGNVDSYLVSRSNPKVPGTSRWLLNPSLVVNQQFTRVYINLTNLEELPLIRSSVRQNFLNQSNQLSLKMRTLGNITNKKLERWLEIPFWEGNSSFLRKSFDSNEFERSLMNKVSGNEKFHYTNHSDLIDEFSKKEIDYDVWQDEDPWV
uniref:PRC-barrel domain-containing protein n=1 Tax=Paulinella chromatophora TaxID=39717 RepID=B1X4H6_PAUCH|nr:hypothetical protein PCC_0405 [Paulinella chromatophora]ACB42845.1 hypothetical protein PCC_0405 [Paulinella chromatophora]